MKKKSEALLYHYPEHSISGIALLTEPDALIKGEDYITELTVGKLPYQAFVDVLDLKPEDKVYRVIGEPLSYVGWIKQAIEGSTSLIDYRIMPMDVEMILKLMDAAGDKRNSAFLERQTLRVFIDTEEERIMAEEWTKPMESYRTTDPMYRDAPVLMHEKALIWVPQISFD